MGIKLDTTYITRTASTEGGDAEFWTECGIAILTKLHELGMPIDLSQMQTDPSGFPFAGAPFIGESYSEDIYETGGFGFSPMYLWLTGGNMIYGESRDSFPIFTESHDLYSETGKTYQFTIKSGKFKDTFVFKIDNFPPIIITPVRSLSNPDKNYGYRGIVVPAVISVGSSFSGIELLGGKILPKVKNYDYSKFVFPYSMAYEVSSLSILPEVDSGKILTTPFFTGVEDTYYQDLYLTNLSHSQPMAKAFETDQGTFLVVQSNLQTQAEYWGGLEDPISLPTSWDQISCAQVAVDITGSEGV